MHIHAPTLAHPGLAASFSTIARTLQHATPSLSHLTAGLTALARTRIARSGKGAICPLLFFMKQDSMCISMWTEPEHIYPMQPQSCENEHGLARQGNCLLLRPGSAGVQEADVHLSLSKHAHYRVMQCIEALTCLSHQSLCCRMIPCSCPVC